MTGIHFLCAILSTLRLTEVITQDRIFEWIRKKWPLYIWTCPRCISIWMGAISTLVFFYFPFGNWPFALSFIFLIYIQLLNHFGSKLGNKYIAIIQRNDGNTELKYEGIATVDIPKVMRRILENIYPENIKQVMK